MEKEIIYALILKTIDSHDEIIKERPYDDKSGLTTKDFFVMMEKFMNYTNYIKQIRKLIQNGETLTMSNLDELNKLFELFNTHYISLNLKPMDKKGRHKADKQMKLIDKIIKCGRK